MDDLKYCTVIIPEQFAGDVMGRLNSIGALLVDGTVNKELTNEDGLLRFGARIPTDVVASFRRWLTDVSQGEGKVEIT
jgi:hypothetical protein